MIPGEPYKPGTVCVENGKILGVWREDGTLATSGTVTVQTDYDPDRKNPYDHVPWWRRLWRKLRRAAS